jgi:chromosome segregation protein
LNEAEARRDRQAGRLAQIKTQQAQIHAEGMDRALLTSAEMEVEAAQEFVEEAAAALSKAESDRVQTRTALDQALEARTKANADFAKLKAEADALSSMVAGQKRGIHDPVLDQVSAQSGWEKALAAALGEDLDASLASDAPLRWTELPPINDPIDLPNQAVPLAKMVTAPRALARRLASIGVVEDLATALSLRDHLTSGQRLATKSGDLVRWDGLIAVAGAPSPVAVRLANANRLRELQAMIEDAVAGLAQANKAASLAEQAVAAAQQAETQAREAQRRSDGDLVKARASLTQLTGRFASWEQRMAAISEQVASAEADRAEAETQWQQAKDVVESIPSDDGGRLQVETLRAQLAGQRSILVESRSTLDRVRREEGERVRRLEIIDKDRTAWADRIAQAKRHLDELEQRKTDLVGESERLMRLPQELAAKRTDLLDRIAAAEAARRLAADALMKAEAQLAEADRDLRQAENALREARETQIRDEAALTGARERTTAAAAKIAERMDVSPEKLRDLAEIDPDNPPDKPEIDRNLDRLVRERDAMGPVNLRAEIELKEIEDRLNTIVTEKADLEEAIAKLRRAISDLNAEGRERLKASFQEVDGHFRDLFVKLFGGGRAHLALVESDDPLQAGLEIMASPPGKRLQILSLLSGGEQALTALALLFAVFMTNPAPICVLDEVDAPLDDANVDRFCTLVQGIAKETGTRFLIVTHHRMTMARMHRLYGVTMAERGVSQLVSVDLEQAVLVRDRGNAMVRDSMT